MVNSYNYYFGGQAGLFIASLGFLAEGIIYLDEFYFTVSGLMLLVTCSVWFKIYKLREKKTKLFRVFVRLCIASVFLGVVFSYGAINFIFLLSGGWINELKHDDST